MTSKLFEQGIATRRKVLGDKYVDQSLAKAAGDDFLGALQQAVTEFGWGAVWNREGLSLKERSMITVAMLTALNKQGELALHIRGAFNNGVTETELREILIHAGCYCGWPAAVAAFKTADAVRRETD